MATETFTRSIFSTIIGLAHVILGFISTVIALIRISLIGLGPNFFYGSFVGVGVLLYEANSIILWASGIGILRGKKWGIYTGFAWCGLAVFFHFTTYFMRNYYMGIVAPPFSWGDYFIVYYSIFFVFSYAILPLTMKQLSFDFNLSWNFSMIRNPFTLIREWRNK